MKTKMTIKAIIILAIIGLHSCASSGQNSIDKAKIKNDFVTDSLGCIGLRLSYIDATKKTLDPKTKKQKIKILIGEINFIGQTRDSIINFIGKPNKSNVRSEHVKQGNQSLFFEIEHLWYDLSCGKTRKILTIQILNEKIEDVTIIEK